MFPAICIAWKHARSIKILFRNFNTEFNSLSSLLNVMNKEYDSNSTSDHEHPGQGRKIYDFVLGPEEHNSAYKIRKAILDLHSRNVNEVQQALEDNHYCNQMQLTTNIVDCLLQNFGDDWKSALGFFQWTGSRPGYKHTSYAYNKMVDLLGKVKQMDQMFDMVEKMKLGGFVNLETVAKIMRRLVGAGKWRDAVSFFDNLGHIGFAKNTESMNLLLDALCKEKKVKVAREVYIELKAHIPADAYTFNIFVNGWCNTCWIDEAIWTMQEMRGNGFLPSVITYSTILKAYCKQFNFLKAYEVLDEMVANECPPNVVSYTIFINSLIKSRNFEEVWSVVNKMKSSGCKPDTRFYNTLINALGKAGRLDDAIHFFDFEMKMNKVSLDLSTYNIMISLFCEYDQEQNARRVLKEMEHSSCKPVLQTFYPLLKLCFRMRKQDDQLKSFLTEIETKHHLSLDLDAYTLIIHGLCVAGNVELAYFYFNEMIDQEILPRLRTCQVLMDLAVEKNMNVAVQSINCVMSRSNLGVAN